MAASASGAKGTDFYRILNVSRTATTVEIKKAYRKLAMSLHPDRHDGDTAKVDAFKAASEAYSTLSDHSKRTEYDQWFSSSRHSNWTTTTASPKRRPPPPNYRKVYIPRPPPGVRAFDDQRHFDMHYGDGMMREELDRVRREMEREKEQENSGKQNRNNASSPFGDYESPLGQGFTFTSQQDHNPYSKRSPQGPPPRGFDMSHVEYEEVHFYDYPGGRSSDRMSSRQVTNARDTIRDRLEERRQERILKGRQPHAKHHHYADESGCSIM